jgi:hypothetical protein
MSVHDKRALRNTIGDLYPEIGESDIGIDMEWDETRNIWVVELKRGDRIIKTFLEPEEADECIQGKPCVALDCHIPLLMSNKETQPPK